MPSHTPTPEIACQQVMAEDASVFSIQWADLPVAKAGNLSPQDLLNRYLKCINKYTLTIIRPTALDNGIEFRLIGSNVSLIRFLPPTYTADSVTLHICGGYLVQPRQCERGELRFGVEHFPECVRVSLQLSEFCPLILGSPAPSWFRFWLYRLTQAAIHRLVTVRFLASLYRELVDSSGRIRVVNVAVRAGKSV